jgi:hypothetical protein
MSDTNLTINGGFNSQNGLVSVPSAFGANVNDLLQTYLTGLSGSIMGSGGTGSVGFENYNVANGTDFTTGPATPGLEEITNIGTDGVSTTGSGSYSGLVASDYAQSLVVQAPGDETITANAVTNFALFGANSNVDYVDSVGSASSIFAAGGTDSISILFSATASNDTIVASGNTNLQLLNQGSELVTLSGSANGGPQTQDNVQIQEADATITATGNASVNVYWYSSNSGGNLDFINSSSNAATVYSSVFNGVQAATHVTVDGGAGGGYYSAGTGGNSSLYGGTGVVTLVGAANGDTLTATGYSSVTGQGNDLFAGSGTELLTAASTTGNNLFLVGYNYPGLTTSPDGNGTISSSGSGAQTYFLGKVTGETVIGSAAATSNVYNIISDSTVGATGGSNFVIENFSANSVIFLDNAEANGPGSATISNIEADPIYGSNSTMLVLSDNTQIHLIGVSASSITTGTTANGTTYATI